MLKQLQILITKQIKMTPIDELIEFIETWGNGTSDRNKELTVNDIYKYAQALQLLQPDVSGSVAFAKWIGERMNVDSWFKYDARFGTWYWHSKGHLTTEELYEVFVATDC